MERIIVIVAILAAGVFLFSKLRGNFASKGGGCGCGHGKCGQAPETPAGPEKN